jgi:hypothetical protein
MTGHFHSRAKVFSTKEQVLLLQIREESYAPVEDWSTILGSKPLHHHYRSLLHIPTILFRRQPYCGNDIIGYVNWFFNGDEFNFCVSMHHYIWVYWDQLDANCLVLFYYTFFTLHVSDVIYIHPQERHIMRRHGVERVNSPVHLPVSDCMCILWRSWGWMYITSETCRAKSVIK